MFLRCFVVFALLVLAWEASGAFYGCIPCFGPDCNVEPEECLYGVVRDACGRMICAAGPGERCGGKENHLGKCGDGMTCKCGKCRGCSTARLFKGEIECENSSPMCT